MSELDLVRDADQRGQAYIAGVDARRVFPDLAALEGLTAFDEILPDEGVAPDDTLALLDKAGSPATVASNGPRYYGFVVGASLPVAAAAERMMMAWDQAASLFETSPVAARLETVAGRWLLDILDLPRDSAVGFGTSASACGLTCLAAARRALLARQGWDFDGEGLDGAPILRVVISATAHVTLRKALRVLGFGMNRIEIAPTDSRGRIDPAQLPGLDDRTILCLQAGEVNTGESDPFPELMHLAEKAGTWVHVDGAFGLWARGSRAKAHLIAGVERADSWTVDGHKWLNTPYDGAMAICRDRHALAAAMTSDAVYSEGTPDSQKNLSLEFSRRARGIPIWAALRTLGRRGVEEMIDRHCRQAQHLAGRLSLAGFDVLGTTPLNQVLARAPTDEQTVAVRRRIIASGDAWFGQTLWEGRPALRISVSSWRTQDAHIEALADLMTAELAR